MRPLIPGDTLALIVAGGWLGLAVYLTVDLLRYARRRRGWSPLRRALDALSHRRNLP